MKLAIADPPYFGYGKYYQEHPDWRDCNTLEWHQQLIDSLADYDGWALHMTSGNLHDILPLCPKDSRVAAWVKPFCAWKKGVPVVYAWEPVIFHGGRARDPERHFVRDWCAANIMMQTDTAGAKPPAVTRWILEILGAHPDDDIHDLFPGSGYVRAAIEGWREAARGNCQAPLFK